MKILQATQNRSAVHIDANGVATIDGDTLTAKNVDMDHPKGFEITYEDGTSEIIEAARLNVKNLVLSGELSM